MGPKKKKEKGREREKICKDKKVDREVRGYKRKGREGVEDERKCRRV